MVAHKGKRVIVIVITNTIRVIAKPLCQSNLKSNDKSQEKKENQEVAEALLLHKRFLVKEKMRENGKRQQNDSHRPGQDSM